jgi:hypothetical protein
MTVGQPRPNKIATAAWFIRRPSTYLHLTEMVRRSLSPRQRQLEATRSEAQRWGGSLALTPRAALDSIFGPGSYDPVVDIHAAVMAEAEERVRQAGVALGGPANLELLYHLVVRLRARRVVETGVAYGWSSLAVLLAQRSIGGGELVSTDMPYPRGRSEHLVGCAVPQWLRGSWKLLRWPDRPALPRALAAMGSSDLVHYDSDKTYAGQSWAFPLIWKALRPGGVLIADDVHHQTAFRDFVNQLDAEPIVVDGGGKLIGIIRKPS